MKKEVASQPNIIQYLHRICLNKIKEKFSQNYPRSKLLADEIMHIIKVNTKTVNSHLIINKSKSVII